MSENVNEYKHNEISLKILKTELLYDLRNLLLGLYSSKDTKSVHQRYTFMSMLFYYKASEAGTAQKDKSVLIRVRFLKGG